MGNEQGVIRVLIADDSQETRQSVRKLLSLEDGIEVVGEAANGFEAVERAKSLHPHVVLMDMRMPEMDGVAATEAIATELPTVQVIMMSVAGTAESLRRAMLAGAREYLVKPFEAEELVASVRRVCELYVTPAEASEPPAVSSPQDVAAAKQPGAIIAVFGPKGGVGRTTVASNLAVALAASNKGRVALVDGCLRFGDVGMALGLRGDRSIADLGAIPEAEIDGDVIDGVMAQHQSGLRVLLAPPQPEKGELVTAQTVRRVLQEMQSSFDCIVVDVSPALADTDTAVLDMADKIICLFTLELTAIKDVKLFLELANALGYKRDKMILVANRVDDSGGLRLSDVEARLHFQTAVCIRNDSKLATYALNKGVPFVLTHKHSGLAQSITDLARLVQTGQGTGVPNRQAAGQKAHGIHLPFGRRQRADAA